MTFGAKSAGDSPLIARNQVRLTLAGARAIIAGAEAKAQAMGVKENIAVVDDGGHLIAFERMEGGAAGERLHGPDQGDDRRHDPTAERAAAARHEESGPAA